MTDRLPLAGKVVVVTGASKGIGAATVGALGRAGASIVAHYGSDRRGATAASRGITAHLVQADLVEDGSAESLWHKAVAWRQRVDVLVLNAAVMLTSSINDDDEHWESCWETSWKVNVAEPVRLMRSAVSHFRRRGGGILITMSSTAAHRGANDADLLAYAATKAALKSATQTIARAYARDRILAYVVAPGTVDTRLSAPAPLAGPSQIKADADRTWIAPLDVAELIVWLASGRCGALSGATIDINGANHVR